MFTGLPGRLERLSGFEPEFQPWHGRVLPLDDDRGSEDVRCTLGLSHNDRQARPGRSLLNICKGSESSNSGLLLFE